MSPSASTEALALPIKVSSVVAGFGMMTTVGTVGTVLTRSVSVAVSVNPIGSVTVTVMLCSPELRALVFRVSSPLSLVPVWRTHRRYSDPAQLKIAGSSSLSETVPAKLISSPLVNNEPAVGEVIDS